MAVSKRKTYHFAEYAYMVLALLLISDALTPILYPGGESFAGPDESSNPARLLLAIVLYGISALALSQYAQTAIAIVKRRPELLVLVGWTILSVLWADEKVDVLRRVIAHLLTVLFCLFVVARYSRSEFFERLMVALFIGGVASIVLCLVSPATAIHHEGGLQGSWHGAYPHKAILGHVSTIAILLCSLVQPDSRVSRQLRWPTLVIFTVLLIMSQSRTGWLTTLVCLILAWLIKIYLVSNLEKRLRALIGVVSLVVVAAGAVTSFVVVLTLMGRDLTFSGRTVLWNAAIQVAERGNTWIGVGYKNFWLGKYADQIKPFIQYWPKIPGHGHNGYLDAWLELGWIGFALLLIFIILTLYHLIRAQFRYPGDNSWTFLFILFLQFLGTNFAATVSLTHTELIWCAALLGSLYTGFAEHAVTQKARLKFSSKRKVESLRPSLARRTS